MADSSGAWTIDDHLKAGDDVSVTLFQRMEALVASFGPGSTSVSKTAVTFKGTRRGFAGGHPTRNGLVGYFDLMRALSADPRITSVSPYQQNLFVHHFRLVREDDFDESFAAWLAEAYAVGCGAHLRTRG